MRPRPRRPIVLVALIASLTIPRVGLAWGKEGHRIVARIAAKAGTFAVRKLA